MLAGIASAPPGEVAGATSAASVANAMAGEDPADRGTASDRTGVAADRIGVSGITGEVIRRGEAGTTNVRPAAGLLATHGPRVRRRCR